MANAWSVERDIDIKRWTSFSYSVFHLYVYLSQVNVTESADSNSTEENTIKVEVNTEDAAPASEESTTPSETAEEPVKTADASEEL